MSERFAALANKAATLAGNYVTFLLALGIVLLWAIAGPLFGFSETWQLVINTGTTIVTFLMVFLIQNTQNRDTQAMHIKLDEIIRATKGTHNAILDMEDMDEDELARQHARYLALAEQAREVLKRGGQDVDTPPVEAVSDSLRRAG